MCIYVKKSACAEDAGWGVADAVNHDRDSLCLNRLFLRDFETWFLARLVQRCPIWAEPRPTWGHLMKTNMDQAGANMCQVWWDVGPKVACEPVGQDQGIRRGSTTFLLGCVCVRVVNQQQIFVHVKNNNHGESYETIWWFSVNLSMISPSRIFPEDSELKIPFLLPCLVASAPSLHARNMRRSVPGGTSNGTWKGQQKNALNGQNDGQ